MRIKSRWIPLMAYEYYGNSYIVLCRKNLRNGMLYFKCKKMNGLSSLSYKVPAIDVNMQFELIKSIER